MDTTALNFRTLFTLYLEKYTAEKKGHEPETNRINKLLEKRLDGAEDLIDNHYALYVVIEDYIQKGYYDKTAKGPYSKYEGARFSDLFRRQRELPFGAKLQNHALNARLNDEFKKYYPNVGIPPIIRDVETQRYWIQEDLLEVTVRHRDGKD